MEPRPILLVADPLCDGLKLHPHVAELFTREGYLVLHCPPEAMKSMRVLAPAPFTKEDVDLLRGIYSHVERWPALLSIADRIEGLL